jgi:DNA sulfur modification protein DndE
VNKSSENIVIRNCRGLSGHGGIVIGSETSGGVKNVYATNCRFDGTDRIVRLKTARGRGGVLENMWFKGLSGENILREAIHLNMLYTGTRLPAQPVSITTPTIRNIHFENIRCLSGKSYAIELLGLPERAIENVSFDSITANTERGINLSDVRGFSVRYSAITSDTLSIIKVTDGENITVDSMTLPDGLKQFMHVEGARSKDIRIRRTGGGEIGRLVSTSPEVPKEAVAIGE